MKHHASPLDITNAAHTPWKAMAIWLFTVATSIFAMAIIGAITRLTESGLSMVEWRPLIGALPPLNEVEWQRVFDLYRETPEYIHKNAGMDLGQFKQIFFWEWFHRLWGRMIGVIYAVPFLYFLVRRQIPRAEITPLVGLLFLGGFQGVIGWYMVKSGLIDMPSVSHYRLALHLSMAFILYVLVLAKALRYWRHYRVPVTQHAPTPIPMGARFWVPCFLIGLTIIYGAFVAGLDAGLIYNSFPLMGGTMLPSDATGLSPLWINFFDNHTMVQFIHRWLGILSVFSGILLWSWVTHRALPYRLRQAGHWFFAAILLQMGLGIATLISVVDIHLATLHQAGALLVLSTLVILRHRAKYPVD